MKSVPPPGETSFSKVSFRRKNARCGAACPAPHVSSNESNHVGPFVRPLCPAPPVARKPSCHCLAAIRRAFARSTQTTLPDLSVSSTQVTTRAPGYRPGSSSPSPVSVGCFVTGHVGTGIDRCPAFGRMCEAPASSKFPLVAITSDFWRPKLEAPPYPSTQRLSRFGTVSCHTYKVSPFRPLTAELFAASFLKLDAERCHPPDPVRHRTGTPGTSCVKRTRSRRSTPLALLVLWS